MSSVSPCANVHTLPSLQLPFVHLGLGKNNSKKSTNLVDSGQFTSKAVHQYQVKHIVELYKGVSRENLGSTYLMLYLEYLGPAHAAFLPHVHYHTDSKVAFLPCRI